MSAHIVPAGAAAPVVPLVTAHRYWDHHWFVWLPRHPVYESVEVMSIESAGGHCRAVWVFFTEREGGKHQFKGGYSAGIQVAAVYFGHWSFSRHESGLRASQAGLSFAVTERDGGVHLTAPQPGYHNRIAVDQNAGGALTGYRHEVAPNRLAFSLGGALPLASDAPPAVREFAVHMNPGEPVARGEAVSVPMEGGRRVIWRMDSPPWTADYAFESIIEPSDGGHTLTIRTLRR